jgi:surface polysaccharide O-acyltransferase-like enzyme
LEKAASDQNSKIHLPDDLIRTVAIFLVVLLHASNEVLEASSVPIGYWWTAAIYKTISLACVPLFVMLSGALLLQPIKLNEPIRVFLKKRLNRLGLAFAFWSGVYLAWGFFLTKTPITFSSVSQGIVFDLLSGAYYHFWFIYLIAGLYLVTPILRIIIAYGSDRIVRYLILLWFIGVGIVPIINLASGIALNSLVFVIGGWVGYYVLGAYMQKIKVRSSILYALVAAGFLSTLFGLWLMNYPLNFVGQGNFFFDYLTINVIIGSSALFMILMKFRVDWPGSNHKLLGKLTRAISKNTLPIYLGHIIILESFILGFFGFKLSYQTLNPIIEIPLIAVATFFLTLGLVLLMRKVPILNKLIG